MKKGQKLPKLTPNHNLIKMVPFCTFLYVGNLVLKGDTVSTISEKGGMCDFL